MKEFIRDGTLIVIDDPYPVRPNRFITKFRCKSVGTPLLPTIDDIAPGALRIVSMGMTTVQVDAPALRYVTTGECLFDVP